MALLVPFRAKVARDSRIGKLGDVSALCDTGQGVGGPLAKLPLHSFLQIAHEERVLGESQTSGSGGAAARR
jgi:hypothetical protein